MTICLLGSADGPEVRRVYQGLASMGQDTLVIDTWRFPEETGLTLCDGQIWLGGQVLPKPKAVYVRGMAWHPLTEKYEEELTSRPRGCVSQCDEIRAFLESFLLIMEHDGVALVNGLAANLQHSQKIWQLQILRNAGLPVPPSLATNTPAQVRAFAGAVGNVIYKPLAGGATVQSLTEEDLSDERLAALQVAPVLFQEKIEGIPVRAYVVGDAVVAAGAIHSENLDYRESEGKVVPTDLFPAERDIVLAATRACGMLFSGVDLIRRPGKVDECAILECNPSPMFAGFENKTQLDIATPLAELLCSL